MTRAAKTTTVPMDVAGNSSSNNNNSKKLQQQQQSLLVAQKQQQAAAAGSSSSKQASDTRTTTAAAVVIADRLLEEEEQQQQQVAPESGYLLSRKLTAACFGIMNAPTTTAAATATAAAAACSSQRQERHGPSTRGAAARAAAAQAVAPMSSTIQALRTIFQSLTDFQFTSEVETERQRRLKMKKSPGAAKPRNKKKRSAAATSNTSSRLPTAEQTSDDDDDNSNTSMNIREKRQKTNSDSTPGDDDDEDMLERLAVGAAAAVPEQAKELQQSPLEPTEDPGFAAAAALPAPSPGQLVLRRPHGLLPLHQTNKQKKQNSNNNNNNNKSSRNKSLKRHAQMWEDSYRQLQTFRQAHGHVNVSCTDPAYAALYRWMSKQKSQWRNTLEGKTSIMTPERIQRLLAVGLTLQSTTTMTNADGTTTTIKAGPTNLETAWEEKYLELCAFKEQYGHLNISRNHTKDNAKYQSLARWCGAQRENYKNRLNMMQQQQQQQHGVGTAAAAATTTTTAAKKKRRQGTMTGAQMDLLTKIGFSFSKNLDFAHRFTQISHYKALYGDTRVPVAFKEMDGLGYWVFNQKKKYHAGRMRPERIQLLQTIGFDFTHRCAPNGGYRSNEDDKRQPAARATAAASPQSPVMDMVGV